MKADNPLIVILRLATKDLIIELRRPHELLSIIAFTLSSIIVSSFSWRTVLNLDPIVVSATLWMVIYFASILMLTTSFAREVDRGTIDGIRSLPCPPYTVIAGKMIYGMITLFIILASLLVSSMFFLNLEISLIPALSMVLLLGAIDFAVIGSIMSAILMYSEGKNLLLAFLFFPVSIPILLPGIQAGAKVLSNMSITSLLPEVRLLVAFMLVVATVSMTLFKEVFLE